MKHLYLIRHAQANNPERNQTDFDRSLSMQGQLDAKLMSNILTNTEIKPVTIISSPALRTKQTSEQFATTLNFPVASIYFEPKLYEAKTDDLYRVIHTLDNQYHTAIIVGHNPSIGFFLDQYTNEYQDVSPCTILHFELNHDDWSEFAPSVVAFKGIMLP